jgi:hypothetical protein
MSILQIMPVLAYAGFALTLGATALGRTWLSPGALFAVLGIAFAGFSLLVLWEEGLWQFWINHTTSLAGNQVWFDLLISVALAFFLISPRARTVGMALGPWAVAVGLTASVALLPMVARLLWLERQARR